MINEVDYLEPKAASAVTCNGSVAVIEKKNNEALCMNARPNTDPTQFLLFLLRCHRHTRTHTLIALHSV